MPPKKTTPKKAPKKAAAKSPKATKTIKKTKKADKADKPKRAPGPYMLFCKAQRPKIVAKNPKFTFGEVGKELGAQWKKLSDAEKKKYAYPSVWPGAPVDSASKAAYDRTVLKRFQNHGHTRVNPVTYYSTALAPARDALTMRPWIDGSELLPPEWTDWQETDFSPEHPMAELFRSENDDVEAEYEYVNNIRDLFPCPPADTPMMLGYPVVSEEAIDYWSEIHGVHFDSPVGDLSDKNSVLLLQIAPHGPSGSWAAFTMTEANLRERKWDTVAVKIYAANKDF